MAIQKYQPTGLFEQFQNEISNLFDTPALSNFGTEEWAPAVDIKDEDNQFVIHADLPGVKSKDINVSVDNGMLTIKGQREIEKKQEKDNYKRIERFSGSFMRRFSLPESANIDKIFAKTKDGVLELTIPKNKKTVAKRIDVKEEK